MDEDKSVASAGGAPSGAEVTLGISVRVADMETMGVPATTRTTTAAADGSAMQVTWGAATPDTRSDKTEAEKTVKTLWCYQFDGEGPTAPLRRTWDLHENMERWVSGAIWLMMPFASPQLSAKQTIYVVANVVPAVALGDLKSKFDGLVAAGTACTTTIPTTGLPMCARAVIDPMTVTTTTHFALKSMMAKVTYSFEYPITGPAIVGIPVSGDLSPETFAVTLKNIASGTGLGETLSLTSEYTPPGGTKTGTKDLGELAYSNPNIGSFGYRLSGTIYVPENIAGQATVGSDVERILTKAPKCTYFELKGRDSSGGFITTYNLLMGTPSNKNDFNVRRNCSYNFSAKLLGIKETDKRITLKEDFINLSTSGTANCYIVTKPNTAYGIKATVRGNGKETVAGIDYSALPKLSDATRGECAWETGARRSVIDKIAYRKGMLVFTTGSATEGNAVVEIGGYGPLTEGNTSVLADRILWSWHIWMLPSTNLPKDVTCSKYLYGNTSSVVDFKMMDRNLGAKNNTPGNVGSIGLIYQWGRKDPFPGSADFTAVEPIINGVTYDAPTATVSKTVGTESYAIEHPETFIEKNDNYPEASDWLTSSKKNNSLWGTPWVKGGTGGYNANNGEKTIYDPCPLGYRVPPMDTWSMVTTKNSKAESNGWTLTAMAPGFWFPIAPGRANTSGNVSVSSIVNLCNHSSSPYNATGILSSAFKFTKSTLTPKRDVTRAGGAQVRCMKE